MLTSIVRAQLLPSVSYYIQTWHDVDLWMPYILMLVLMRLTLMQGHNGSAKAKQIQRCMLSATKQAISIKLASTVGHCLHDLDFANVYMACTLTILLVVAVFSIQRSKENQCLSSTYGLNDKSFLPLIGMVTLPPPPSCNLPIYIGINV